MMLYPQQNELRNLIDLSGVWDFQTDPEGQGETNGWYSGLPAARPLAVPGSWNEQYEDLYSYLDPAWYLRQFYVPEGWQGQRVMVRVGSANYAAQVWLNGREVGGHEGGHLPFEFDVTAGLDWTGPNTLSIRVENELKPTRVPAGNLEANPMGGFMSGYPSATFDFYPYAGLHRPVLLYSTPQTRIEDVSVVTTLEGTRGLVEISVTQSGVGGRGRVLLEGKGVSLEAALVFVGSEARAVVAVENARLWSPEDPYLYEATLTLVGAEGGPIDRYQLPVGIRTVQATPDALLLNGKPIYLKGFGRHEDFYVNGRGLNVPLIVKDFSLLKWVGANSYRTAHYPYSEEEMNLADRQGILIVAEIPAVSLQFEDGDEAIQTRLKIARRMLQELVARDKNHPSVILWSVANEPMPPDMIRRMSGGGEPTPADEAGRKFLGNLVDLAHDLDKTRPAVLVGVMGGPLTWLDLSDIVCVNRYWGWYTQPGQPEAGARLLAEELDGIRAALHKPVLITEFGADTIAGMHSIPAKMFTEEYQVEFLRAYLDVTALRPYVIGLHVWNFADFQATQSVMRVGGMNHKGVFTRARQPKMAAHFLRERWAQAAGSDPALGLPSSAETQPQSEAGMQATPILQALEKVAQRLDGKYPGMNRALGFQLEGEGWFRLLFEDGHCRAEAGEGSTDAAIRMTPEDAGRLLSGELNPIAAVITGRIKISGDMKSLAILQSLT
jgi:beta-glucuronidase